MALAIPASAQTELLWNSQGSYFVLLFSTIQSWCSPFLLPRRAPPGKSRQNTWFELNRADSTHMRGSVVGTSRILGKG